MIGIPDATSCIRSLNRAARMALPMLLAYAICAHLIVVSFGTVALASGIPAGAGTIGSAAVLCHPGASAEEATGGAEGAPGDMPHGGQRWCCGLCLLQGAEPWAPAVAFAAFSHERAASVIRWRPRRDAARDVFAVVPTARGPPSAFLRAA